MKQKEYIGITGFRHKEEIHCVADAFADSGINQDSGITAMIGFLISESQAQNFTFESKRFPSVNKLGELLEAVPYWMMPTMHYCSNSIDIDKLSKVLDWEGHYKDIAAVQLNLDWPAPEKISKLKERYPGLYIIQQLDPNVPGVNVKEKIMEYAGLVDKLLIDPSLGAGKLYDIRQTSELINEIASKTDKFSYVVCGGLDADNVYKKVIEAQEFVKPLFSIDAEGRLRTQDGMRLDLNACRSYVSNAAKAFSRYR